MTGFPVRSQKIFLPALPGPKFGAHGSPQRNNSAHFSDRQLIFPWAFFSTSPRVAAQDAVDASNLAILGLDPFFGHLLESHLFVEQRHRKTVLQAVLSFVWVAGLVSSQGERMQIELDPIYIFRSHPVFLDDFQERLDGPMRRAARRVILRDGAALKFVTFAQVACHRLPI